MRFSVRQLLILTTALAAYLAAIAWAVPDERRRTHASIAIMLIWTAMAAGMGILAVYQHRKRTGLLSQLGTVRGTIRPQIAVQNAVVLLAGPAALAIALRWWGYTGLNEILLTFPATMGGFLILVGVTGAADVVVGDRGVLAADRIIPWTDLSVERNAAGAPVQLCLGDSPQTRRAPLPIPPEMRAKLKQLLAEHRESEAPAEPA
ncbi:MAG: hypothetical protein CMJ58_21260 [Planctomycetaceae bacterium]|nr:hypothetical protein [Planctomycetaceae bacterium]